jgi:hypothetical protein
LTEAEQQAVLACLHEDRFQDSSRAQAYAALQANRHALPLDRF